MPFCRKFNSYTIIQYIPVIRIDRHSRLNLFSADGTRNQSNSLFSVRDERHVHITIRELVTPFHRREIEVINNFKTQKDNPCSILSAQNAIHFSDKSLQNQIVFPQ